MKHKAGFTERERRTINVVTSDNTKSILTMPFVYSKCTNKAAQTKSFMSTIKDFLQVSFKAVGDPINDVFAIADNPDVNLPESIPQRLYMPPCEYLAKGTRAIYLIDEDVPPTASLFAPDGYAMPLSDTEAILVCQLGTDGPILVLGWDHLIEANPQKQELDTLSGFVCPSNYLGVNIAGIIAIASDKIKARAAAHLVLRQKHNQDALAD